MPPTDRPPRPQRREDLEYDDQITPDNEAPAAPAPEPRRRGRQWLRDMGGPDHLDVRWERGWGNRGWLSVRDPFTLERHVVPTKYAEGVRLPEGQAPAPQEWVRRAMEKLPPREDRRRSR